MDFHLQYRGALPASQGGDRRLEKQEIREYLSPQLEDLWRCEPLLAHIDISKLVTATMKGRSVMWSDDPPASDSSERLKQLSRPASRLFFAVELGRFRFVPLVNRPHQLLCELDIQFLRREDPGSVVDWGGDLDNRLKTFFDALRIPCDESEIKRPHPGPDRKTVFCLLEDDALITRFNVSTGRLLGPLSPITTSVTEKSTDVELRVHVTVKPAVRSIDNLDW